MVTNQSLLDSLIRQKIYLLGYSKQLAGEVVLYLKETEPEVRELILKLFGVSSRRVITRLRDAESQLRQIRSRAWKRALEYITLQLLTMAEKEHEWYQTAVAPFAVKPIDKKRIPALVSTALLAGQTLKEVFATLERSDTDRAVAQLRLAYLSGDESVTKAMRRMTGSLSYVTVAANNAISTVTATAVVVAANAVHHAIVVANSDVFDTEVWISILDGSTTLGCRDLHLKRFKIGVGPTAGYHWHCRSDRVPYWEGGGDISAKTYAQWIASQSEDLEQYAGKEFSFAKLRPMKLTQIYRNRAS